MAVRFVKNMTQRVAINLLLVYLFQGTPNMTETISVAHVV